MTLMAVLEVLGMVALLLVLGVTPKLLVLYRWHRAGLRWPGEDLEDYIEHSPRFEDGIDTRTGMTVDEYRDWATGKTAREERAALVEDIRGQLDRIEDGLEDGEGNA